jgi:hypothetical protein
MSVIKGEKFTLKKIPEIMEILGSIIINSDIWL